MARKLPLRKAVDETDQIRCKSGRLGLMREEVYIDTLNAVVKYNLAFVCSGIYPHDNGRVLGYDNGHGFHERHYMGTAHETEFLTYEQTLSKFLNEVAHLKEMA